MPCSKIFRKDKLLPYQFYVYSGSSFEPVHLDFIPRGSYSFVNCVLTSNMLPMHDMHNHFFCNMPINILLDCLTKQFLISTAINFSCVNISYSMPSDVFAVSLLDEISLTNQHFLVCLKERSDTKKKNSGTRLDSSTFSPPSKKPRIQTDEANPVHNTSRSVSPPHEINNLFPPDLLLQNERDKIINDFIHDTSLCKFEEAGCAVCSRLSILSNCLPLDVHLDAIQSLCKYYNVT